MSDDEDARKRVRQLLLPGDNTMKHRDGTVEVIRRRLQPADPTGARRRPRGRSAAAV